MNKYKVGDIVRNDVDLAPYRVKSVGKLECEGYSMYTYAIGDNRIVREDELIDESKTPFKEGDEVLCLFGEAITLGLRYQIDNYLEGKVLESRLYDGDIQREYLVEICDEYKTHKNGERHWLYENHLIQLTYHDMLHIHTEGIV